MPHLPNAIVNKIFLYMKSPTSDIVKQHWEDRASMAGGCLPCEECGNNWCGPDDGTWPRCMTCGTCGNHIDECPTCRCPEDGKCRQLCEEENGGRCPFHNYGDDSAQDLVADLGCQAFDFLLDLNLHHGGYAYEYTYVTRCDELREQVAFLQQQLSEEGGEEEEEE